MSAQTNEAVLKVLDKLSQLNPEELERLVDSLIEAKEALAQMARIAAKLKETGVLDVIETFLDSSAEQFNAMTRPDIMSMVANMMMAAWILGQIPHGMLVELGNKVSTCTAAAKEEFDKTNKKLGLMEMLNIMRSPEFAAALKAMQKMLACLKSK
ncbi:DUF1641 domain-containing protein [Hyperthermus butylicus]|uniref:Uncharacterized protein n=1 Tax=Hyperthermus butylicus (strain DSM 5456 / JCM 9403 / PLM1-5) TaxID=415426 RepID=A2BK71_HYPBU|nr:DUF1641 domain-containing protein [Hyperthermus butylicus]ABM80382.1 hypothetical protein Hbut_0520 [Hyperthermus butylicus DSM 5456]